MQQRLSILLVCALLATAGPGWAEEPPEIAMPTVTADPQAGPTEPPGSSLLSFDGVLCLVNRDNRISKDYVPADLIIPRVATRKKSLQDNVLMRAEAARALEAMFLAAKREENLTLYAASGYRSFGIQQILFSQKVQTVGSREKAQKTVAPAGTSEHQLGLAMDVQAPTQLNLNRAFGDTPEGQWLAGNAHRFGFILRYKREWTDITGYLYEPWHIRYVGVAHARAIHTLDVPLEIYIAQAGKLPEYVLRGATDQLLVGLIAPLLLDETAVPPAALMQAAPQDEAEALQRATLPFLAPGLSYEAALWAIYPTPRPTAGPRVDSDVEANLFGLEAADHGIAD
ncbi:MAG: M15 family metallopeptidase [Christensenellales bacterium]